MFGPQFGFGNMVFGSLGIVFGLSWWSTFTAVTVGVALISFVLAIYGHATLVATFRFIEVPLEGQSSAGSPEP
jgi:cytosine/uracil/thiamine/allantoin permease